MIQSDIPRVAAQQARLYTQQYPVLLISGPRQSGKTTLAKTLFTDKPYVNLEALNVREFAEADPVGFLNQYPDGAIFDEVQRVPKLLSEIQVRVDETRKKGQFILTGSHQPELQAATAQSLAGRVAILKLLPLSLEEWRPSLTNTSIDEMLYQGFYPRVLVESLNPTQAYNAYIETYIEKDLRQITQIRDLSTFQRFMRLCAGRIGQVLNIDQLANDAGVSATTVRHWLSALEASYVIMLVRPYFKNISKRLVKSPKLYFFDVGVASCLLGIESAKQWPSHPLRGLLFENLVVMDLIKARWNRGLREQMAFYRDHSGNEVDVVIEVGGMFLPIEIKSSATLNQDFLKGLSNFAKIEPEARPHGNVLIYGGEPLGRWMGTQVVSFRELAEWYHRMQPFFG